MSFSCRCSFELVCVVGVFGIVWGRVGSVLWIVVLGTFGGVWDRRVI